jgi:hypothetical protein
MRRFAAVALLLAGVAIPACAQRGGGRGGFSNHSSGAFHGGGFTASAPSRFTGNGFSGGRFSVPPRFTGSASFRAAPSSAKTGFGSTNFRPPYSSNTRAPYNRSSRYRRIYVSRGGAWSSYAVPGWIWPGYLGSPYTADYDDSAYDNSSAADNDVAPAYDTPLAEQDEPPARNPYYASAGPSNPSPAPKIEEAVTLVFKDGRAPEEIHNYALTRTTLYVMDEHRRAIPVDEIDLDATEKLSRDTGVDFQLPVALR